MDLNADTDKGGYIAPLTNCPHSRNLPELPLVKAHTVLNAGCAGCSSTTENWLCLTCHYVGCSRYVKGHMISHRTESSHNVAISLADLNTWCYECESYVISREIDGVYRSLHFIKFGNLPGENLEVVINSSNKKINILGSKETEEAEHQIRTKVDTLAEWIQHSKHCVLFTGAGISTSAKIPDFRGPEGVWTLKAKGLQPSESLQLESALPTVCHMAIVGLQLFCKGNGKELFVVSQNIDGLHRRSGLDKNILAELHGNSFKEICWKCNKDYIRTFDTAANSGIGGTKCAECLAKVPKFCHCTPRKCEDCGATLKDSIIHFGEDLPADHLTASLKHASSADLCIVLGSSLTVSPANQVPQRTKKNKGKVVIVNLQETIYDETADLRIFGKTDIVMQLLAQKLAFEIPKFELINYF